MALGNWDSFVVNEKGKLVEGFFKVGNVVVKIYKNWIYVEDKKSWEESKGGFCEPTIMEIEEGLMIYKGIKIVAKRMDKYYSLYFAIWTGWKRDNSIKGIFGIATYGYDGENYVGVRESQKIKFKKFIKEEQQWEYYTPDILDKIKEFNSYNQGDAYIAKHLIRKI